MLRCAHSALRRTVNARFSGPSITTKGLGLLMEHRMPRIYSLTTVPPPWKMHPTIQALCPMTTSAVQHRDDVVRGRRKRTVNNLDPKRLNLSDIIDITGPCEASVTLRAWFGATRTRLVYSDHSKFRFPPNSRGFLYYHSRPGLPPGAGEIRFRVVDPRSASHSAADLFANGNDLFDHTGHRPWRIHMLQLYTTRTYDPIRRLLLSQGLIGAAQDRETEQRVSVVDLDKVGRSTILDTTSDTFVIQLPIMTLNLAFIHDERIVPPSQVAFKVHWRDRLETVEGSEARWREYQGAAVVRFELKKAEADKMFHGVKEGEVVLVLRILELLDPVGADGVTFRLPEGGDLVQGQSPSFYWSMSLDKARRLGVITPSSLKILEELYLGDNASAETTATKSPSV